MSAITLFEEKQVRRAWNKTEEKWYFAIVDVISILTGSVDPGAYWRKLKERLKKDGNETVTNCHALKMTAADGKQRLTDVADTEQLLRLIQSHPAPQTLRLPRHPPPAGRVVAARPQMKPNPTVEDLLFDADQVPIEAVLREHPPLGAGYVSTSQTLHRIIGGIA